MTFRWAVVAGGSVAVVIAMVFTVGLVLALVDGDSGPAIQAVGMVVMMLGLAGAAFRYASGRAVANVRVDEDGTTFRPDRGIDVALGIAIIGMVVNAVSIPFLPRVHAWLATLPAWGATTLTLLIALAILGWCIPLWRFLRWGSSSYLRMSADSVKVTQALRPRRFDWDRVCTTAAAPSPRSQRRTMFVMKADTVWPNGAAVCTLVDYYRRHPEARVELHDGEAVRRFESSR